MPHLVTGVAGFVGRHLVRRRAAAGEPPPFGADRVPPDEIPNGEDLRGGLAEYRSLDVTDSAAVDNCVREARPEAVVHLAAQASGADSLADPVSTYRVNLLGSLNLLDSVRRHAPNATVILVGSADAYGSGVPGRPISEETPLRPLNPYAASKASQDMLGELYAATYGLRVVRTRTFSHTGPGQRPRFALAGFADQLARMDAGLLEPALQVGNLEGVREYGDVRDVVEAYERLIERGEAGQAYNVCTGEGYRLRDLLDRLVAIAGVRPTVTVDPSRLRSRDVDYLVGDPARIRSRTGWTPVHSIEETLSDLYRDARDRVRRETGR